jgi:hypothetical protein
MRPEVSFSGVRAPDWPGLSVKSSAMNLALFAASRKYFQALVLPWTPSLLFPSDDRTDVCQIGTFLNFSDKKMTPATQHAPLTPQQLEIRRAGVFLGRKAPQPSEPQSPTVHFLLDC